MERDGHNFFHFSGSKRPLVRLALIFSTQANFVVLRRLENVEKNVVLEHFLFLCRDDFLEHRTGGRVLELGYDFFT